VLSVSLHELAERELNEAAAYYAGARRGLGDAFIDEVQRAVQFVAAFPLAGVAVHRDIRWRAVRRFPYCVYYRVHTDHVRVLAVGHQKRRPFYWSGRA
jgi:hypothetical protein